MTTFLYTLLYRTTPIFNHAYLIFYVYLTILFFRYTYSLLSYENIFM